MSFTQLKKSRKSNLDKLTTEIEKINTPAKNGNQNGDSRIWKPVVDKAGNGYAVIRFLPAPEGEDIPWVRIWDHGFQGPGGWYIENSLTTLNKKDPVSEYNSKLWNSGIEANKEIARRQKRRLSYYSNILVVSDSANPENEGKVFLYKYGKKIHDKIKDAMNPEFDDETPVNPFDLWEGANFKLKMRNVEGFRNYDKSEFEPTSALLDGDDEKLESLWKQEFSLQELLDARHFKSYDQLKARLDRVLGLEEETSGSSFAEEEESAPTPMRSVEARSLPTAEANLDDDDSDDDSLSYFSKLAEEA